MRRPELNPLELALLAGGVQRSCTLRILDEIEDHLLDAASDARAAGLSATEAEATALAALGQHAAIVAAACARRELLEWDRRWPRLAYGLRTAAEFGLLPIVPFDYVAAHGSTIMRWSLAASMAGMLTCGLLLGLRSVLLG
jgi:hypothetical protein